MICKMCADAADRGAGRSAHCRDGACPCQHRALRRPARRPKNGRVSVLEIPLPPGVYPRGARIGGVL